MSRKGIARPLVKPDSSILTLLRAGCVVDFPNKGFLRRGTMIDGKIVAGRIQFGIHTNTQRFPFNQDGLQKALDYLQGEADEQPTD